MSVLDRWSAWPSPEEYFGFFTDFIAAAASLEVWGWLVSILLFQSPTFIGKYIQEHSDLTHGP